MKIIEECKKLKSKDDLESLSEGDKVSIDLAKYEGRITFLKKENKVYYFIDRSGGEIFRYSIKEDNFYLANGKIIQEKLIEQEGHPVKVNGDKLINLYDKIIGD